ncbi:MAG: transcription termination factor Rho [Acidimicrobiales bacterium]|nr:transcription termination factor Rho [Acidimicrobiales bacterium]MDP6299246.1 transcription termination factor Rho [Acidimicrobiales bacterium]HJM98470.1 transcription termination factor Rho [Acidimicrobiales bacterium]
MSYSDQVPDKEVKLKRIALYNKIPRLKTRMTTETPDRKDLESKDKDSLIAIAKAMGGKPTTRATKSDLVDSIIELASGDMSEDASEENNDSSSAEGNTDSQNTSTAYSADPMADARAEASKETNDTNGGGNGDNNGKKRRRRGKSKEAMEEWAGEPVSVEGHLDLRDDGYGFLRVNGFLPSRDDVYVPVKFVRQYGLRKGDHLVGAYRPANRSEKNPALLQLDAINGTDSNDAVQRPDFADLTPIYPDTKLRLERAEDSENTTSRAIDLVAPVGKGQRVLIVSNPRSGREEVIKEISQSIESNYSEVKLLVLLIDTPPEHVTEMRRWLTRSDVIASTFDQSPEEHVAIAELTIERAKRMVEMGEDVAVIIDGMTSLARAYNLISSNSGRQASSDVDASALYLPKRSFGAGRKVEEGGSLTVFASVLSGTSSKLDEMLLQELQGGSTSEIYLSQETAEAHIVPALDVAKSGTQNEEGLSSPEEHKQVQKLRSEIREAASKGTVTSGMELLLEKIVATEDNESLLETYS